MKKIYYVSVNIDEYNLEESIWNIIDEDIIKIDNHFIFTESCCMQNYQNVVFDIDRISENIEVPHSYCRGEYREECFSLGFIYEDNNKDVEKTKKIVKMKCFEKLNECLKNEILSLIRKQKQIKKIIGE